MKKNILLVEDEAVIALSEKRQLEKFDYSVALAHNGNQALEYIDSRKPVDLILMDIDLGRGIDGAETAHAILQKRDLPILFLSSRSEHDIIDKTAEISSYGYISKDSGEAFLDASIRTAFKLYEARNKLKRSQQNYKSIFNLMNDALVIQSLKTGFIIDVNQRMLDMYGYEQKQDVIGSTIQPFCSLEHGCTIEKAMSYIKKASEGVPQLFEWHAKKRNGDTFWTEINLKISEIDGEEYILAVVRDISDRK